MKFFLPKDISYYACNVSENETETGDLYIDYSLTSGYNKDTIRKYGINIYKALTTIYPLATYIWEDLIDTDKHLVTLATGAITYPTAGVLNVAITSGVTVVYVRKSGIYYIAKTTATVDFMSETEPTPAHFNAITTSPIPYRYEYALPEGEADNLYWGYEGKANRYRALDRAVGTQTIKYGSNTLTMSFQVNSANAIALFYVDATEVKIKTWDIIDPLNPVALQEFTHSMIDVSHLNNYEKVCTIPYRGSTRTFFAFDSRYALQIDLTFTHVGVPPKVGAVKIGLLDYIGQTQDGVDVTGKSYNTSEQRSNGEIVWNKDNKESNKVHTLRYNIKLDTQTFDSVQTMITAITDKEVILLGDDGDANGYTTLINYGAITSSGANLTSNSTKSSATLTIENFT